ncbi:hypothetical protein [Streptomyces griseocarneus]|uniref:hypothetical protein n=1 Tax=Streptomyces griseocarneus TaxID=51201 RepID=UPI00167D2ECB|nr:hypothetical protein [Streptomyces griseocarneus]MBZ6476251.1 hypothetical protein [Streptomyces griseocarneus]GHG63102.1 hypothetical protein GCM10018779_32360 [Streptomyces griseocarneus]
MSMIVLLLILLLAVVTLLVGVGMLALLLYRPSWCAPVAGTVAVMTFMATAVGLLVAVTRI